jgi:ribosomal protein S27AE
MRRFACRNFQITTELYSKLSYTPCYVQYGLLIDKFKNMKKIKTNYANKMVDGKFYGVVKVENAPITKYLSPEEVAEGKQGYVLAPYILGEHTEESSKQYDLFMKEYHKQHKYCPKCGGEQHTTTLVGYVLNWDKKDEYKDLNRCVCTKCGDNHSTHDRLPSIEALS